MKIKIIMKSVTKLRAVMPIEYQVSNAIVTLQDLLSNLVDIEIDKYENSELKIHSQEELDNMVKSGKVSFGFKYRESDIDRKNAFEVAIQAFKDGLFTVFINNMQINELDESLHLKENDELSLIRLTMLTGRYYN